MRSAALRCGFVGSISSIASSEVVRAVLLAVDPGGPGNDLAAGELPLEPVGPPIGGAFCWHVFCVMHDFSLMHWGGLAGHRCSDVAVLAACIGVDDRVAVCSETGGEHLQDLCLVGGQRAHFVALNDPGIVCVEDCEGQWPERNYC